MKQSPVLLTITMTSSSNKPPNLAADNTRRTPSELERANRALRTLSAGNHILLHAVDEQELLHEMCRVLVEKGGYLFASVAYAEHDPDKSIRWMAHVGDSPDLFNPLHYTWSDSPLGCTATGTAIRTGKPSIGRKLLTDPVYDNPLLAPVREDAIRRGYEAATAFPLFVDGKVLGALALAARDADAFNEEEVVLLTELAADLSYGIENLRRRIKHHEAQQTIVRLAYYDANTGLPNRTLLLERMEEAIQSAHQQHRSLALLHIRVAIFHELSKVFGYRAGDQLLAELAKRLGALVHEAETLASVSEAGFALLLPRANADRTIQVAQRLMNVLQEPIEIASVTVDARATIGIALYPGHGNNPEALLRRAKAAANDAWSHPGGYALYTGGQEEINTRRLALMADLRRAIMDDELLLYFQPKITMKSGKLSGAEALVRWQHPRHGMIPTIEFVRLAEQTGLITLLTNWVLDAAFAQSHEWHEAGMEVPLSVNLSAHDLRDPKVLDRIRGLLSTWGTEPGSIQLELTESAVMEDTAANLDTLKRLKDLQIKLLIDDFGTGYSSLSYLQKLPVDEVKIDQSFVTPMATNGASAAIVRSAIDLSHNLDLTVVAEGVESQATWHCLEELDCDVAQGYLMSRPLPAVQFSDWARQWQAEHC